MYEKPRRIPVLWNNFDGMDLVSVSSNVLKKKKDYLLSSPKLTNDCH